jgi:DNA-binding CsgD family transcriptional regulator
VLEATGIEPEADLAFGALLTVLRPLLGGLDALPAGQRRALAGALELGRAASDTRFAVGAATLGLIAAAAERAPLLLLLDDVQWIDAPSLEALAFACSRLDADAVVAIAAGRPGDSTQRLAGARFEIVTLGPLADDDAIALLDRSFAALDPRARERLVAAAHGNPLALLEIPARLTEAQRSGAEPVPDELPAGEALASAFAGTAAALPEPTRTALLVLAVGPPDEPRAVAHALASLGVTPADLGSAEEAGLVVHTGSGFGFRHPLVRTAVLAAASMPDRRRAHAAIADALPAGAERARHRAEATVQADETVAEELDTAASAALARGAPSAAVSLLTRAAELGVDPDACDRRILAAGEAAWLAGMTPVARELAERATARAGSVSVRARALHLRGQIAHQTEPAARARAILLEAASLAENLEHAAAVPILADAVASCMYAGDAAGALEIAERLASVATADGASEEFWRSLQLGTALALNGRGDEGAPLVRRAIELVQSVDVLRDDPRHLGSAAMAPAWVDEHELGRTLADRAIARARELGALSSLPTSLKFGAWADFDLGRWDAALAGASEAVAIAREIGQRSQLCANLGVVAAVLGGRGDEEGCREAVTEGLVLADELELVWHRTGLLGWQGLLELGLGRLDAAVATLGEAVALLEGHGILSAAEDPFVNLVEALVRSGRNEEAALRLATYESLAESEGRPLGLGTAARLRGLLEPDDDYVATFERALDLLPASAPFAVARTHLCYGERLRRSGERRRARAQLEEALTAFERLGAHAWIERVHQELRASGRRLRRLDADTRDELTPQELQVALQAARGLTNREIAQALFLSPKTVEFHLTRIYRKLDLHARAELVERFADQVARPGGERDV